MTFCFLCFLFAFFFPVFLLLTHVLPLERRIQGPEKTKYLSPKQKDRHKKMTNQRNQKKKFHKLMVPSPATSPKDFFVLEWKQNYRPFRSLLSTPGILLPRSLWGRRFVNDYDTNLFLTPDSDPSVFFFLTLTLLDPFPTLVPTGSFLQLVTPWTKTRGILATEFGRKRRISILFWVCYPPCLLGDRLESPPGESALWARDASILATTVNTFSEGCKYFLKILAASVNTFSKLRQPL